MAINVREALRGLNSMMGRTQKQQRPHSDDPVQFVNELNHFTLYNSSMNSIILPCTIRQ